MRNQNRFSATGSDDDEHYDDEENEIDYMDSGDDDQSTYESDTDPPHETFQPKWGKRPSAQSFRTPFDEPQAPPSVLLAQLVDFVNTHGHAPREVSHAAAPSLKPDDQERKLARFLLHIRRGPQPPSWFHRPPAEWASKTEKVFSAPNKQAKSHRERSLSNIVAWCNAAKEINAVPPTTVACCVKKHGLSLERAGEVSRVATKMAAMAGGQFEAKNLAPAVAIAEECELPRILLYQLMVKLHRGVSKREERSRGRRASRAAKAKQAKVQSQSQHAMAPPPLGVN